MDEVKALSELISDYADKYMNDSERVADGMAMRAMVQGMLVGSMMREHQIIKCTVTQDMDENGDYYPCFDVETASGHRIRVSVDLVL